MSKLFLLIGGPEQEKSAKKVFEMALEDLGRLQRTQPHDAAYHVRQHDYGLVVIDATTVTNVEMLISGLRLLRDSIRIVVVTASPTWSNARAAFEAGATDYIPKSSSFKELRAVFEEALRKVAPPWPR